MGRKKKYLTLVQNLFLHKYLYIHIGYWIFYILFFTVQRFAFYGYSDFVPNLKLNLAYLPNVLICTYVVTEYVIPALFSRNNLFSPFLILVRDSLAEFEHRLSSDSFLRIHKSYLINIRRILGFSTIHVMLKNNELPVGRVYREKVMKILKAGTSL